MPVAGEESEVEIEVEDIRESSEPDEEDGEEDMDANVEEDPGEDELESEGDEESHSVSAPLKITLKLGAQPEGSGSKPSVRRYAPTKNEDVESEDSDSVRSSDVDDPRDEGYGFSRNRQLTARQAALASAGDSPAHVALETERGSRKRQLPPSEVALRKEENARKRKNMLEKKLEDEKAETINRLLKKQSRPKHKRTTALNNLSDVEDATADMDVDAVAVGEPNGAEAEALLPTMYRWVSTSRALAAEGSGSAMLSHKADFTFFCVPESLLPPFTEPAESLQPPPPSVDPVMARCAVPGCDLARKYRAVGKEWGVGACGMPHLRVLDD